MSSANDTMMNRPTTSRPGTRVALALTAATAALLSACTSVPLDTPKIVTTPSGLQIEQLRPGNGPSPKPTDVVQVHYQGMFPDGRVFDSSYQRGSAAEFPLNKVIVCWTEGLQMMKVGEKARLTCPPQLAYGSQGAGGGMIPPNATLMFDVELLGVRPQ